MRMAPGPEQNDLSRRWASWFVMVSKSRGPRLLGWRPILLLIVGITLGLLALHFHHLSLHGKEDRQLQEGAPQIIGVYSTERALSIHLTADIFWNSRDFGHSRHHPHLPFEELYLTVTGPTIKPSTPIFIVSSDRPAANSSSLRYQPTVFRADSPPFAITAPHIFLAQTEYRDIQLNRQSPLGGTYGTFIGVFRLGLVTQAVKGSFYAHLPALGINEGPPFFGLPSYMSEEPSSPGSRSVDLIESPELKKSATDILAQKDLNNPLSYVSNSRGPRQLYWGPQKLSVTEILEDFAPKLTNVQSASIVPGNGSVQGQNYVWTQSSTLEPTVSLTSEEAADSQSNYAFLSGVFFGIVAAVAVAFIQEISEEYPFSLLINAFLWLTRKLHRSGTS